MSFSSDRIQHSLERLIEVASGSSGQSHHVRRLLLGIFNAYDWPFELNRLRALDLDLVQDALNLIAASVTAPEEIHAAIPDGDRIFQAFWKIEAEQNQREVGQ
ncbi:hypothetical protein [Salinicola sp. MIT1003]|uniref:DUF7673 family protein n=1 Tax=Salinicola sp. MIT1003 TaxID=1882734 RepID=UPI0008DD92D7|nr:hypothetical protein [Salinicola sp. MIT1003]OHZ01632.1 hypothetical protein BC443_11440 [Salinicola sp. MIT1003]